MKLLGISCFLYICEVEKSEILVQLWDANKVSS